MTSIAVVCQYMASSLLLLLVCNYLIYYQPTLEITYQTSQVASLCESSQHLTLTRTLY